MKNKSPETWKWVAVFILFAIFLGVTSNTCKYLNSVEDFEPPDDYLHGDSYDLQYGTGTYNPPTIPHPATENIPSDGTQEQQPTTILQDNIDWENVEEDLEIDWDNI